LKLEKLAQTSYTQILIKTKLQNNKSNNEILLKRANAFFLTIKIKTINFGLKLAGFNSYFFMILILGCSF